MSTDTLVQRLSSADIAQNVALSRRIGWPDTDSEWRVIYEAAVVLGVRNAEGALLGQGALGLFERAGSIAKMVVAPEARRRGIGAAILDDLLRLAAERSLNVVGLVATPLGRPLYEAKGFAPLSEVVILGGTPQLEAPSGATTKVVDAEQMLALERRFMGSSRDAMLRARLREACATASCAGGFALATAHDGLARIGPILAESEAIARALTMALFQALPGLVRLDVPGPQHGFRAWLRERGLLEKGLHLEMQRGAAVPWNVPERFGLATQAWG